MIINNQTAILCSNILLVPYKKRHVPIYFNWMQDEQIRIATASNPLTLAQEYVMQEQWATHADKLTFIICIPPSIPQDRVIPGLHDAPEYMVGDVNLFLKRSLEFPHNCVGELAVMIAPSYARRRGWGRAAVLIFLHYLRTHLTEILREFVDHNLYEREGGDLHYMEIYVRVGENNEASIRLFQSIDFAARNFIPNFFSEVELKMKRLLHQEDTARWLEAFGLHNYTLLPYIEEETN